ncbi:hypothetical protein EV424DRAFT_1574163 [Suillus variegatus]|nr:hypothetical protein EV424DRAFT_1574163 [Suillus variegatus]
MSFNLMILHPRITPCSVHLSTASLRKLKPRREQMERHNLNNEERANTLQQLVRVTLHNADPNVIVGYDFLGVSLDILSGVKDLKVEYWSHLEWLSTCFVTSPATFASGKTAHKPYWQRMTLNGGRAEGNEYILLYEFHHLKCICPDMTYHKKAPGRVGNKGKRDNFKGGLVFEPKRSLWDKCIVIHFNSLYLNIIQEYKIDFTTLERLQDDDNDKVSGPPLPEKKKYAALKLEEGSRTSTEVKGLDMKHREYCGKSTEIVVDNIHEYLNSIGENLLKNAQATGGQLTAAPGPQASGCAPDRLCQHRRSPSRTHRPAAIDVNSFPIFHPQSNGPPGGDNLHLLPSVPAPASRSLPGPFRGGPPLPPVMPDETCRIHLLHLWTFVHLILVTTLVHRVMVQVVGQLAIKPYSIILFLSSKCKRKNFVILPFMVLARATFAPIVWPGDTFLFDTRLYARQCSQSEDPRRLDRSSSYTVPVHILQSVVGMQDKQTLFVALWPEHKLKYQQKRQIHGQCQTSTSQTQPHVIASTPPAPVTGTSTSCAQPPDKQSKSIPLWVHVILFICCASPLCATEHNT